MIKAKPLKRGDKVAIIAPSSATDFKAGHNFPQPTMALETKVSIDEKEQKWNY